MNLAGTEVLEFTGAGLGNLHVGHQRQDDIGRVSLFKVGFDAQGIGGIDEDAGVLGSYDGFDD